MKIEKTKLLFIATLFFLVPPMFTNGSAGAAVFNPDGATHNTSGGWSLPPVPTSPPADRNNCLACHQTAAIGNANANYGGSSIVAKDAKESYLNGGHKNMLRPVDGNPWGMPAVDSMDPYMGDSTQAGIDSNGLFTQLWTQEHYPGWSINWATGQTGSSDGYCGTATGVTSTSDLPDLAACAAAGVTCETPIMGNGTAGYPLGYTTSALCTSAKNPNTGTANYVWTSYASQNVYWIYGGAGLEGGPAIAEPGTQFYWCGRCHSTGWTADSTIHASKLPESLFPGISSTTAVGGSTALLNTNNVMTGGNAYPYSSWDQWGIECSMCHASTGGGHATWPTSSTRGGDITALCMGCHRQDNGAPMASYGFIGSANVDAETILTNTANQPDGFVHYSDGNEFLNSPHAKFSGTWGQIGCPPYAITGYTTIGYNNANPAAPGAPTDCDSSMAAYGSNFAAAANADFGITDGGGCTTCHDVHKPHNENIAGMGGNNAMTHVCTDCHSNAADTLTPQINLSTIDHPAGAGTPLENAATDPSGACSVCHQPEGMKHLWRINTDPSYSSFGNFVDNAGMSAPTAADGSYAPAVWVDIDHACGQCHGGGVSLHDSVTTGTIAAGSNDLTVGNSIGFAAGKEITISGAGVGGGDFKTIIAKVVDSTHVTLTYPAPACSGAGACGAGVSNAVVTVAGNPPANGAMLMTAASLAKWAATIHIARPAVSSTISAAGGSFEPGVVITLTDTSTDPVTPQSALQISVDWNDGTPVQTGVGGTAFTHVYTEVGTYVIVHTAVNSAGKSSNEILFETIAPAPPVASITGTVYNCIGSACGSGSNAAAGIKVKLRAGSDPNSGAIKEVVTTDSNGLYTFTNVDWSKGPYTIVAKKVGTQFSYTPISGISAAPSGPQNLYLNAATIRVSGGTSYPDAKLTITNGTQAITKRTSTIVPIGANNDYFVKFKNLSAAAPWTLTATTRVSGTTAVKTCTVTPGSIDLTTATLDLSGATPTVAPGATISNCH